MYLPDINFWLALAFEAHHHSVSATTWMNSAAEQSCSFCRVTQMGLLRLATNPKVFGDAALTMPEAWTAYEAILADQRVNFANEPPDIETAWKPLTQLMTFSTNVWTDAYLAAFAQSADLEIVTFDRGFARYENLRRTILT